MTYSKCRRWSQAAGPPFTCEEEEGRDVNSGPDVYRWDEAVGVSECVTCEVKDEAKEEIPDVGLREDRPVMVSDDFSHLYFESLKQLVPGQGSAGDDNVYALSGGMVQFVADVSHTVFGGVLDSGFARLSASGDVLVFNEREGGVPPRTLTSDRVAAECPDLSALGHIKGRYELYRYDDRDRSLECVSCVRGGVTTHSWGGVSGATRGVVGEFDVSADGSTIVFPTAEALVRSDVNGGFECRQALSELPGYASVAGPARRAAERVVAFQAFQACTASATGAPAMAAWARSLPPAGTGLEWWETAAAAGSSLGVHAMIAAAAQPEPGAEHVAALEAAYFPWIGALHSLLDHLVDAEEDSASGQRNLIGLYGSSERAAERLGVLTRSALAQARTLAPPARHELIVAAMASFYLSAPEAHTPHAFPITRAVLDALGTLAPPALKVFRVRRALERLHTRQAYGQSIRWTRSARPRSIRLLRSTGS